MFHVGAHKRLCSCAFACGTGLSMHSTVSSAFLLEHQRSQLCSHESQVSDVAKGWQRVEVAEPGRSMGKAVQLTSVFRAHSEAINIILSCCSQPSGYILTDGDILPRMTSIQYGKFPLEAGVDRPTPELPMAECLRVIPKPEQRSIFQIWSCVSTGTCTSEYRCCSVRVLRSPAGG
jgi:hypothetical protein